MLKNFFTERFFNWTKRDVAAWETIRQRGLARFMVWYGLGSGGLLFVLIEITTAFVRSPDTLPQHGLTALASLLGGLINGLLTWWMEDQLYYKFKKIHNSENPS